MALAVDGLATTQQSQIGQCSGVRGMGVPMTVGLASAARPMTERLQRHACTLGCAPPLRSWVMLGRESPSMVDTCPVPRCGTVLAPEWIFCPSHNALLPLNDEVRSVGQRLLLGFLGVAPATISLSLSASTGQPLWIFLLAVILGGMLFVSPLRNYERSFYAAIAIWSSAAAVVAVFFLQGWPTTYAIGAIIVVLAALQFGLSWVIMRHDKRTEYRVDIALAAPISNAVAGVTMTISAAIATIIAAGGLALIDDEAIEGLQAFLIASAVVSPFGVLGASVMAGLFVGLPRVDFSWVHLLEHRSRFPNLRTPQAGGAGGPGEVITLTAMRVGAAVAWAARAGFWSVAWAGTTLINSVASVTAIVARMISAVFVAAGQTFRHAVRSAYTLTAYALRTLVVPTGLASGALVLGLVASDAETDFLRSGRWADAGLFTLLLVVGGFCAIGGGLMLTVLGPTAGSWLENFLKGALAPIVIMTWVGATMLGIAGSLGFGPVSLGLIWAISTIAILGLGSLSGIPSSLGHGSNSPS